MSNHIGPCVALPSTGLTAGATTSLPEAVGTADRAMVLGVCRNSLVRAPDVARFANDHAVDVELDRPLLNALTSYGQMPRVAEDTLGSELGALTAALVEATSLPCVPMTISCGADLTSLEAIATGLYMAAAHVGGTTAVVVQTDLLPLSSDTAAAGTQAASATSHGAVMRDAAAALQTQDVDALCALGAGLSEAGAGQLVILAMLASRLQLPLQTIDLFGQVHPDNGALAASGATTR